MTYPLEDHVDREAMRAARVGQGNKKAAAGACKGFADVVRTGGAYRAYHPDE